MTPEKKPEKPGDAFLSPGELQDFLSAFEREQAKPGVRSVLVVDDEPSVRRMVSRSMTSLDKDLVVHQAENGKDALEMLEKIRKTEGRDPVMIVTDLQMPVMDGWDFIDAMWKKLQSEGHDFGIPLVVLSSSTGTKGMFFGKSVHGEKCPYNPLATVAKEDCIKPVKYDAQGEKGLIGWLKFFLHKGK